MSDYESDEASSYYTSSGERKAWIADSNGPEMANWTASSLMLIAWDIHIRQSVSPRRSKPSLLPSATFVIMFPAFRRLSRPWLLIELDTTSRLVVSLSSCALAGPHWVGSIASPFLPKKSLARSLALRPRCREFPHKSGKFHSPRCNLVPGERASFAKIDDWAEDKWFAGLAIELAIWLSRDPSRARYIYRKRQRERERAKLIACKWRARSTCAQLVDEICWENSHSLALLWLAGPSRDCVAANRSTYSHTNYEAASFVSELGADCFRLPLWGFARTAMSPEFWGLRVGRKSVLASTCCTIRRLMSANQRTRAGRSSFWYSFDALIGSRLASSAQCLHAASNPNRPPFSTSNSGVCVEMALAVERHLNWLRVQMMEDSQHETCHGILASGRKGRAKRAERRMSIDTNMQPPQSWSWSWSWSWSSSSSSRLVSSGLDARLAVGLSARSKPCI